MRGRYRWNPLSSFSIALVGQVLAWKQCLTDRTPSLFIIIFTSVCISYFQWPLVNLGLVSKLYTILSTIKTWLIWEVWCSTGLMCSRWNCGLFSLLFKFWNPCKEDFWNLCKEDFWSPKTDAIKSKQYLGHVTGRDFEIQKLWVYEARLV